MAGYEIAFAQGTYIVEEKPAERQLAPLKIVCGDRNLGAKSNNSWGAKTHEGNLIGVSKKIEFSFSFEGILR